MELAQYIYTQIESGSLDEKQGRRLLREVMPSDIAIVGMSCEFSGAPDLFSFEEMLRSGRNGFIPFPSSRRGFFPRDHEYLVNAAKITGRDSEELFQEMCDQLGAYIGDVDKFDNDFFEISEKEALYIDPMHRIILKHLYLALEHSGTTRAEVQGSRAAVYVGKDRSIAGSYASEIERDSELINPGTWEGILASRLNYLYDLSGGSLVVDTACSSSLVATHIAGKMLRDNEIDMALVGGIALGLAPRQGELFGEYASVETTSDHLKVFDQASSGTIFGEGAGVVVLRRLEDALERNDHIYAVLRATGINSDGRSNGLTAPNPKAQANLISETYAAASINPATIDYVDAHGTGTKLGDPIEIRGLTDAFRGGGLRSFGTCALSSLKENVGHTVGAAGVGGMIKMALALDSRLIFPSSSFVVPNDYIKFIDTPFYIPTELTRWEATDHPRRGSVSSFGFSGTNGHIVLEEAEIKDRRPDEFRPLPFVFSAPSRVQLLEFIDEFVSHREIIEERRIIDIAYTLTRRRQLHHVRLAFTAASHADLFDALARFTEQSEDVDSAGEFIFTENPSIAEMGSESAKVLAAQYAEKPEIFSLSDLLRLAMHGSGDFLSDFNFDGAIPCGLPGFRFARKSFWGTVRTYDIYPRAAEQLGTPLAGQILHSRVLTTPDTDIYCMSLNTDMWFLEDHRIAGESTLSGTAYAQLAAEIAVLHFGEPSYEMTKMTFKNLIQVKPQEHRVVYVQVAKRNGTDLKVDVFSGENETTGQAYTPYASFTLRRIDKGTVQGESVNPELFVGAELVVNSEDNVGAFVFSGRWDLRRNLTRVVKVSETEYVLAHELDNQFVGDLDHFFISPSVLDLLAGVIGLERSIAVSRTFLPLSYGRMLFTGRSLSSTSYSRTQLHYHPGTDPSVASADVWVYNQQGELVIHIERYSMRAFVPQNEILGYHEIQLQATSAVEPIDVWPTGGLSIVSVERRDALRALSTAPEAVRESVRLLTLDELAGESIEPSDTLIYVSCGSAQVAADPSAQLNAFFAFAKTFGRHVVSGGKVIVLVGNGLSQGGGDPVVAADYAILSAARVVAMENPKVKLFAVSDDELDIPRSLSVTSVDELSGRKILLQSGAVYLEKLVPVLRALPARRGLPSGGTVLVTGGFGGIGAEYVTSLWNELGCAVTVLGRRSLDDLATSEIASERDRATRLTELVGEGLDLRFVRCDVADETQVISAIETTRQSGHVIAGVVHLAGVPEDGMLFRKSEAEFHAVVDAKALGATFLLKHIDPEDLQFFIVSSSMTTITGAPGQFAYTLANAFLEGLARSNTVVSATRWPGWKETGMAVAFGVASAPDDSFLLEPLTNAAAAGYVRQSITREYVDLIAGRTTVSTRSMLDTLVNFDDSVSVTAGGLLSKAVRGDAEMVVKDFASLSIVGIARELDDLEKLIAVLFASVLDIVEIDVEMSFTDMGGDSMKAFSIYTPLVEQLDVDLEVADIFIYSSVLELSGHVRTMQDA